jgi:DNA primase
LKYTSDQIEKINNSINIVDYASRYLDLEEMKGGQLGNYRTHCVFHEGDTNASLNFNKEKNLFHCLACDAGGSLITFVMLYHKLTFPKAIEYILKLTNLSLKEQEFSEIYDYLNKENQKSKKRKIIKRVYLDENEIEKYTKKFIKEWIDEGIKQEILDKYNVRYDLYNNSIVFPIRDINGRIIAFKARTLFENYADFGIPKYQYYQKIITNDFLYGLYENIEFIKEKNEVIVFEGSKSCYKSEGYGYKNCVSLETNNINEDQIDLLLQLKCDIIFALDKGIKVVTEKKKSTKDIIYVNIGMLPKFTNVYSIEDDLGLLPAKASPVDEGKEVFDKLYERRLRIE